MVMYASQIQQQIMLQQQMAAAQASNSMQMSHRFGTSPHMGAIAALQQGQGGMYGEAAAQRIGSMGQTAVGLGGFGLGIAGMFTGLPLDPFSAAIGGARMGYGAMGLGGAALGAGAAMLPFYAAGQAANTYGGAFFGGMNQQRELNSTLRTNFNFSGGQGAFGRGFSQNQMGQIGQVISQEARQSPFTSSQELNDLISGGSDAGMFTAVRDVQQFSQRFRTMLDSLRKIQKELGGTLSEALQFTKGSQQLGIFSSGSRTAFAAEMRDTMAVTGMSQDQLFGLAAQGSMLSRATGGVGRQGATGALRMARTLGSAVASGVINQEALSEATGGLTGTEAIQAFTGRMLQQTERFSRRGMGRFSIFALSNAEGTGLDEGAVDRFLSGDISTSGVMRDAHSKVRGMGRARAMNREGLLRGALMEQGGLAGQIGMMRLMVGDRVMDQSDDLASMVLQRRFGMQRPEAEMMMSLMRNQGQIAQGESVERAMAGRETRLRQDITENRSLDAFMEHLQHGVQDAVGVTRVREIGRNFMTKISGLAERAMNDVLGIQASTLTTSDNMSIQRLAMGMATSDDVERLRFSKTTRGQGGETDVFAKPLAQRALSALGMHSAMSVGETMAARGVDMRGMTAQQRDAALRAVELAQSGVARGADGAQLDSLLGNRGSTLRRLVSAELSASMRGEAGQIYGSFGDVSANALDAFRSRMGLGRGLTPNMASLLGQGGGSIMDNLGRIGMQGLQGVAMGAGAGLLAGGPLGALFGGVAGGIGFAGLEAVRSVQNTDQDRAIAFLASGGHFGREARLMGEALGSRRAAGRQREVMAHLREVSARRGVGFDEAAAMRGSDGVESDQMRGVMGSESFQMSLRRLDSLAGNKRGQEAELENMELEALRQQGPQRQAALLAVRQLRHNIRNMGGIGNEFRGAIQMTEREIEMRRRFQEIGSQYAAAAEGATGDLRSRLTGISEQFYNAESPDAIRSSIAQVQDQLAGMKTSDAAYREMAGSLGGSEIGRSLLMGANIQRAFVRDASGGGRRGRAQQAETVLGSLTGGSLGSMEFSIGGRQVSRRNQARAIFEQFRTGGKGADELESQLATQLTELIGKDATGKVRELRGLVSGGVTQEEAKEIFKKFESDPELQRVRKEGIEKMQRDRDPLGVERNNLLGEIRTGINKLVDKSGSGGVPMSTEP